MLSRERQTGRAMAWKSSTTSYCSQMIGSNKVSAARSSNVLPNYEVEVKVSESRQANMSNASQDVRYALRQLRRNTGFTLTAVVTMGLGIGATAAIFSAVYSLLLRPLPYQDANQIMSVSDVHSSPLIDPDFVAVRTGTRSFQPVAGFHTYTQDTMTGIGDPVRVTRAAVTANFFPVLGVIPALGRNFSPDEDWSGSPNVLLLSDHFWRNKFNADPKIVGKSIQLDGTDFTVIGVLPRHFGFPGLYLEPDIYGSAVLERTTAFTPDTQAWGIQTIVSSSSRRHSRTGPGGDASLYPGACERLSIIFGFVGEDSPDYRRAAAAPPHR